MGAIMVIGIVHKNGILMLDSEQHYTAQGLPLKGSDLPRRAPPFAPDSL
ncbi:MAG: hypothetical protein U0Y68_23835 [Blastocatellia bacterium]